MTNRCRVRIASTMCWRSGLVVIVQQTLDAILPGDRFVVQERQLGDALEAQPRPDLPAEERSGPLDGAAGVLAGLVVAEHGVEHARLLKVRGHLDPRDRHESNARIAHLACEQQRELASDLIRDAVRAGTLGHKMQPRRHEDTKKKKSSSCSRVFVATLLR